MAASVISPRDGRPFLTRSSRTCVAQISGTWAASRDPHDLFLHLGDALETHFDGKIAAGDHHRERLLAGGLDDDLRQIGDRQRRLDLADQREPPPVGATRGQFRLKGGDMGRRLHEGMADHVGVADDEIEVAAILVGERVEAEIGVGEVKTLLRLQFHAGELALVDTHEEAVMRLADDGAEELAVVERHMIVDGDAIEDLRQGAGDLKGHLGEGRLDLAGEQDEVADVQAAAIRRGEHAAGPDLGAADIHEDRQATAGLSCGGADVGDHARPLGLAVMGAVDAEGVGAGGGEIGDDRRIVGGLGGERDQDAADAAAVRRAEAFGGVDGETRLAAEELALARRAPAGFAGKGSKRDGDGIERGEHTAFEPAEGGNAKRHQFPLQRPEVAAADDQVMGEIEGARPEGAARDAAAPLPEQHTTLGRDVGAQGNDFGQRRAGARLDFRTCGHGRTLRRSLLAAMHDSSASPRPLEARATTENCLDPPARRHRRWRGCRLASAGCGDRLPRCFIVPTAGAMPRIVISYRRADDDAIVGRIRYKLASHYGDDFVFMDIDNIPFGVDFRRHIEGVLQQGEVVIAVMGRRWTGPIAGGPARIFDAGDPVRIEIETTLKRGIPVVPVLVGGATMPTPEDLPDAIRDLSFHNAAEVDSGRDFHQHMDRLIQSLDRGLGYRRRQKGGGAKVAARIGTAVVVLAIAGGGAWFYLSSGRDQAEPHVAAAPTTPANESMREMGVGAASTGDAHADLAATETDKPVVPDAPPAGQPAAAVADREPTAESVAPASASPGGPEPVATAPVVVTAPAAVETPAAPRPTIRPEPKAPPVVAAPAAPVQQPTGPETVEQPQTVPATGEPPSPYDPQQFVLNAAPPGESVVTAVQDELFRLCDQPYRLKLLSSFLGPGISLYAEGFLAMPIQVPEAKPTRVTDTCEVTVTNIGGGPAPIVTMRYRPVAADGSNN